MVERVMVVIGLKAALPTSFSQIWRRSCSSNEHLGDLAAALGGDTVGRADREAGALDVADHARLHDLGRAVDDTADDAVGRDRAADHAAAIDALERAAGEWAFLPLEVPPRQPV